MRGGRVGAIISSVLTVGLVLGLATGDPVLRDNGYEGVVVVIGEDVPENTTIIDNIKKMFVDGSLVLNEATGHRAHFRNVTIVVPASWSPQTHYKDAGGGEELKGDVLVELAFPPGSHTPHTVQLGGCGDPGEYVHLSAHYATHMYGQMEHKYGPPGKVLVHEWAHYRWGVFDEYPTTTTHLTDQSPSFYVGDDGMVHATTCSSDQVGWAVTTHGEVCRAAHSGLPDAHCHFYPAHNNTATASLMGYYHLPSVQYFCDDDEHPHNPLAPTPHNQMCGGRSVWAVMQQHRDFSDGRNPSRKRRHQRPGTEGITPTFQLVRERGRSKGGVVIKQGDNRTTRQPEEDVKRFVLLLDISASMESSMNQLYQAVVNFVRYLAPAGCKMAVVSFANSTRLDLNFTTIPEGGREHLVQKLPHDYERNGYTAIGSAMQFAWELMKGGGDGGGKIGGGGSVVLVTDGNETMHPLASTVLPRFIKAHLPLNTISFGPHATESLEDWAESTGGRSYYYSPQGRKARDRPTEGLATILYQAIGHILPSHTSSLVMVYRESHKLERGGGGPDVEGEVVVDSSLGHNTYFTFAQAFTPNSKFSVSVVLEGADGIVYSDESGPNTYKADSTTRTIAFTIPSAQAGVWKYRISRNSTGRHIPEPTEVEVVATTFPRRNPTQPPISVDARVVGGKTVFPRGALVVARVRRGRSAVLEAEVTALVVPPTPHPPLTIPLTDDGHGGDREADDGVYSGYFTQFSGNGSYSLSVSVSTTNKTTIDDVIPSTSTTSSSTLFTPSSTSYPEDLSTSQPTVWSSEATLASFDHSTHSRDISSSPASSSTLGAMSFGPPTLPLISNSQSISPLTSDPSSTHSLYFQSATEFQRTQSYHTPSFPPSTPDEPSIPQSPSTSRTPSRPPPKPRRQPFMLVGGRGGSFRRGSYRRGLLAIQTQELPLPEDKLPPPNSIFNPRDLRAPIIEEDTEDKREKAGNTMISTGKENVVYNPEVGTGGRSVNMITKVEPFSRVVSVGIFTVRNFVGGDVQPPGRVRDLEVVKQNDKDSLVTLSFTSTGDDQYTGTATSLELVYHPTSLMLLQDFRKGHQVEQSLITDGDLNPRPAGHTHKLQVKIPRDIFTADNMTEGQPVFFMLRARDEKGNSGVPSNLATAFFKSRVHIQRIEEEERLDALSGLMVLVLLVAVIGALLVFTCSLKYLHARRRKQREQYPGLGGAEAALRVGALSRVGTLTASGIGNTSYYH